MNTYYINYYFAKKTILNLDQNYLDFLNLNDSKIFLYVNTFEISKFYNLYHPFKNSISLINKFKQKPKVFFENLILEIKKNKYYNYDILFLYSIASYYVISKSSYINFLKINDDLTFFKKENKKTNYYKKFKEARVFDLYISDTLKKVFTDSYAIYNPETILNLSLNKFYSYLRFPFFSKFKFNLIRPFSKNYKSIKQIYKKHKQLKNTNMIEHNINIMLKEATNFLFYINEYLFLNKKEKFNDYFNKIEKNLL